MKKFLIKISWENKSSYTGYFPAESREDAKKAARIFAESSGKVSTVKCHSLKPIKLMRMISNNIF